jgi:serine/threonine-protein kinase
MVKSVIMMPEKFDRYEIKSELGRGGMATVYHAFDPRFKRNVALKVLPREFLHDPTFKARFEREAQTIATLEHPAIVPVYDFGEDHGQPYLVMRLLPGGTLTNRLAIGALPFEEAIRIINRLAPALDEAHKQGIIHRDLKPDNILFDQRDAPFITDFGVVKLSGGGTITTQNVIVGTPAYISPEQARGDMIIDGRSDIYALGVILFQMLSGKLPFNATTPVGLVMKHITDPVPPILEIKPDLPPICNEIINRALAKEPNERFATTASLAAALSGTADPLPPPPSAQAPVRQGNQFDTHPPATPSQANRLSELTCPNCAAPLPANVAPNQATECNNCGSRFIMTAPEANETIHCPNCQTVNEDSLRYCTSCGQRLKVDCVRCHTQNRIDATHCFKCGTNLQSASERRRELQENRRRAQSERDQMLKEKKARQLEEKIDRLTGNLDRKSNQDFVIYQLSQIGDPAVQALVNTLLTDNSRNARFGAAKTLGLICASHKISTFNRARVTKALIKGLEDPEAPVRYYSAEALTKLDDKQAQKAVEPLGALLKDRDENVRKQAHASLEKIGGPRAQEILDKNKGFMGWLKGG